MEKKFTLLHTAGTAGIFSAITFWYGFMIGRESSRRELGTLIDDLRNQQVSTSTTTDPHLQNQKP